jgi:hypothetical protein
MTDVALCDLTDNIILKNGDKTMSHPNFWSAFTLLGLTVSPAFAADSPKADTKKKDQPSRISSSVDVLPTAAMNEHDANQVSFAAGRILKHIAQARDAIQQKKVDDATNHVEQGLKLIAIIDTVLPHHKIKTEIKSGNLAYTDEDDVTPRYLMIFDELERRDIISPIVQARKQTEQKPQSKNGKDVTANPPAPLIGITHADIVYSAAKIDLELARLSLNRAKQDLYDGKADAANEVLQAFQSQGVLFSYEEIDLPLEEVADNLKLAEGELKEGKIDAARAALNLAIDDLKRYEKLVGDNRGVEVKELHQEINKVNIELAMGSLTEADRMKVANKISDWWHTATKWMKNKSK